MNIVQLLVDTTEIHSYKVTVAWDLVQPFAETKNKGEETKFMIKMHKINESNACCKTHEVNEDRPNGDVGIEGNSGSHGKGEWSEII